MADPSSYKSIRPRASHQCTMRACVLLPLLMCLRMPRPCTNDHSAPMTIWHRNYRPAPPPARRAAPAAAGGPSRRRPRRPGAEQGRLHARQPQRRPAAARGPGRGRPRPGYAAACTLGSALGGPPSRAAAGASTPPVLPPACAPRARTQLARYGKRLRCRARAQGMRAAGAAYPASRWRTPGSAPTGALILT